MQPNGVSPLDDFRIRQPRVRHVSMHSVGTVVVLRRAAAAADCLVVAEAAVTERLWTYEALQFGRLCLLLENIEPEENIGYSILIYRLTDEEVNTALYGDLHAVYDLIEKH